MTTNSAKLQTRPVRSAVTTVLLTAGVLGAGSAGAFDFNLGDWNGNWDTTVSYGQLWRVEDRDPRLVGVADGGIGRSPNIDDGNLNYDTGLVSNAAKFVTELSLSRDSYGVFVRASGLYDYEAERRDTDRTPLSKSAKNLAGSYLRLLDAFAYGRFDLNGHELDLRAGNMVVNWGESTFIQGGINSAINHFDVSALRVPGAELREAYLPQEMVKASLALSENVTAEALYLWSWDETLPEPVGTYFSSNDFAVRGGNTVFLGFGGYSDQGVDFRPLGGQLISNFQGIPRLPTIEASDSGQYGAAIKWYLPDFSQGTEFGFYFMNYHSKVPLISGVSGTQRGVGNAYGALAAYQATAQSLAAGLPTAAAISIGTSQAVSTAASLGGNMSAETAQSYSTVFANLVLGGGNPLAVVNRIATHEFGQTAGYFTEYPEDLKLFGISFNTTLGTTGIALQGEVSYKMDTPLQYDDVELLFAALSPLEQALFPATAPGVPFPTECTPALPTVTRCGQLGGVALGQVIQGWGEFDVIQAQLTATKVFGPMLGASQVVAVVEVGVTQVQDFPSKLTGGPNGRGLRFNGPGTSISGNAELAGRHDDAYDVPFTEVEPQHRFPDELSWGYRLALRADYPSAIGAWNVAPRLVFSQDVSGTTPGPGGNFVEDRYGVTVGVNANLRAKWDIDVNYTQFGGAGRWNDINDRDFVAATLKYSF
jgi:hypothetical protein